MPAQQPSKRKAMPKHEKKQGSGAELQSLYKKADTLRYRLLMVHEIRKMFNIDELGMRRFRRLAARDPESDPWIGDKTLPQKFHEWLWGKRLELEKKHRDV